MLKKSILNFYSVLPDEPLILLQSTWDQGRNHLNNTGLQNEQIKYTTGLIYKTIIIYLFHWLCDNI